MAHVPHVLAFAIESEVGVDERDARIADVRLRDDLERAYSLLEHGLGNLGVAESAAAHG